MEPIHEPERKDLTSLFPELKPRSECTIELTRKKIKLDEAKICEKLIAKYNVQPGEEDEDADRMFKDIKVNYL